MSSHEVAFKKFKETMVELEKKRTLIMMRIINAMDAKRAQALKMKLLNRKKS